MRNLFRKIIRLYYTFYDIGPNYLLLRIIYELRKIFDKLISNKVHLLILSLFSSHYSWRPSLTVSSQNNLFDKNYNFNVPKTIQYDFLNQKKLLLTPIIWNNPNWDRLWQFNLHYFQWSVNWIEEIKEIENYQEKICLIEYLIEQWIEDNPISSGDGWHSYTISLRIRNWIWLFNIFPYFLNEKRIKSIWDQLIWLNLHKERCHSGNHLIENLCSLIIGSLHFNGYDSLKIYSEAINMLRSELSTQILKDGGHEERSAAYHLLLLESLVQVGFVIKNVKGQKPLWLVKYISMMCDWLLKIRLFNGKYPNFNDSPNDICKSLDEVYFFAKSYLDDKLILKSGFNFCLSRGYVDHQDNLLNRDQETNQKYFKNLFLIENEKSNPSIIDLPDTGWTIIKLGYNFELIFKCGKPCPSHLGAHVHSDQLSFNLYNQGLPLLIETGTSIYKNCNERKFERSSRAHNCFQLALPSNAPIHWIEPVDTWSSFRAGFKSKSLNRSCKQKNDWFILSGAHNGFKRINASHLRTIGIKVISKDIFILVIIDTVECKNPILWRRWFHKGPYDENNILVDNLEIKYWPSNNKITEYQGYLADEFGLIKDRNSIQSEGSLNKGLHRLISVITPKNTFSEKLFNINADRNNPSNINFDIDKTTRILCYKDLEPFFINKI